MKRARRTKKRKEFGPYHFFIVLPDRMYPFANQVEGQWVRGIRSYELAVRRAERRLGRGSIGLWLNCYRSFFHLLGSILVIIFAASVTREFFGNEEALYVMLAVATGLISYQEFYYHRRQYEQLWKKSVIDWLSWMVPIGMYLFYWR
jgi:hypothetical protein